MAGDRKFEMQLPIDADRDAVWQALTEAKELERWFPPRASVDARVGGEVVWQWGEEHRWPQTIEVFEPGQHLRTRYDSAVDDGRGGRKPLFVDFHLEGDGGTTTLRLVHSGFGPEAAFDDEYDGISGGWPVELRSLKLYLERHRGQDRQLAWAVRQTSAPAAAVFAELCGSGGLQLRPAGGWRPGDRFHVGVPGAGGIDGTVLFSPGPRELSGIAENLGDGWLRISCERWGGATNVWLWLALYGEAAGAVERWRAAFERLLDRTLPAARAAE